MLAATLVLAALVLFTAWDTAADEDAPSAAPISVRRGDDASTTSHGWLPRFPTPDHRALPSPPTASHK